MAVMTVGLSARRSAWEHRYAIRLFASDLIIVLLAVFGSQILRFGTSLGELRINDAGMPKFVLGYTAISLALAGAWMLALYFFATRDQKIIGSGVLEYKRITDATMAIFGGFAIVAFLLKADLGRGYLLMALPIGLLLLLLERWLWRHWLSRKRRAGGFVHRALLLGHREKNEHVAESIRRDGYSGLNVLGALTKNGSVDRDLAPGVPVLGGFDDVLRVIDEIRADTVILTGADGFGPSDMRRLGWDLESRGVNLIVAPSLTDVAGPRIHASPVAGLPLIHVDYPTFEGRKYVVKRGFDIVATLGIVLLASPILLAVAIAVRVSSPGPIFYTQERIGLRGNPFHMLKFRSMVQGADDQLASLLDAQGTSDTPLFKVINDPRITRVGKFIRKYSLDETPQLFNVVLGNMSLVGPRPQREAEVALYDDAAHRRLFMKPGMSGLWQVSGRSDLSWEDSIRLDLYYVENWSLTTDVIILARTVRAVFQAQGAV